MVDRKLKEFADQMIAALRAAGETRPIRYVAEEESLIVGTPTDGLRMNLRRPYDRYLAAGPKQRKKVLQHSVHMAVTLEQEAKWPERLDEVRAVLLPRVHPRIFYARFAQPGYRPPEEVSYWHRPLGNHLAFGVGWDRPRVIVEVPEGVMARW